jgi:hypothetical protein
MTNSLKQYFSSASKFRQISFKPSTMSMISKSTIYAPPRTHRRQRSSLALLLPHEILSCTRTWEFGSSIPPFLDFTECWCPLFCSRSPTLRARCHGLKPAEMLKVRWMRLAIRRLRSATGYRKSQQLDSVNQNVRFTNNHPPPSFPPYLAQLNRLANPAHSLLFLVRRVYCVRHG